MEIKYKDHSFIKRTKKLITQINEIVSDYKKQGYKMTLRQVYYQLVSKNIIKNRKSEYDRIGDIIKNARLAGLLDWDVIVDRTRQLKKHNHWSGPAEIVRSASYWYHINTRSDQPTYFEIWVEKDALASVLEPITDKHDVPLFVCRGFPSVSAKRIAADRFSRYEDQNPTLIYLGDHDPSGLDIPRELRESFDMFGAFFVEIKRVALNLMQIEKYSLPSYTTKKSDCRAEKYISEYGHKSWELDALRPDVLSELVEDTIDALTDHEKLNAKREIQSSHRTELREVADKMDDDFWNEC